LDEVLASGELRGYLLVERPLSGSVGLKSSGVGLKDTIEAFEARTGWDFDGDGNVGKTYPNASQLKPLALQPRDDHYCMKQLCERLMDGKILIELLNLLDPTAKLVEGKNADSRREMFVKSLSDPMLQFRLLPQGCCSVNDLATCLVGSEAEQIVKQLRIVKCLVKLGLSTTGIVVNGKDYMGPRMDEATLGQHGPNEFFSELAILPLEGGWKHKRTVAAMKNSMLYVLAKRDVERISVMYSALKFKLADAAEDYEKAMKLNSTLHLQQANSDVEETVQYRRKLGEHGLGCCIVILCVADLALRMNPQRTKTRFLLSRRV